MVQGREIEKMRRHSDQITAQLDDFPTGNSFYGSRPKLAQNPVLDVTGAAFREFLGIHSRQLGHRPPASVKKILGLLFPGKVTYSDVLPIIRTIDTPNSL